MQGLPCGNGRKQPLPLGHGKVQTNLRALSSFGLGMPQDITRVYMWRSLTAVPLASAAQTFPVDNGDEVARRMTSAQIGEAAQLPLVFHSNSRRIEPGSRGPGGLPHAEQVGLWYGVIGVGRIGFHHVLYYLWWFAIIFEPRPPLVQTRQVGPLRRVRMTPLGPGPRSPEAGTTWV